MYFFSTYTRSGDGCVGTSRFYLLILRSPFGVRKKQAYFDSFLHLDITNAFSILSILVKMNHSNDSTISVGGQQLVIMSNDILIVTFTFSHTKNVYRMITI
jgi:hypothetical protein